MGATTDITDLSSVRWLLSEHGVFRRADARALGLRERQGGRPPGEPVLPGVWSLLPRLSRSARPAAAVLYAGPGAVLGGLAAAAHRGWEARPATSSTCSSRTTTSAAPCLGCASPGRR